MNNWAITGFLGQDPHLRTTKTGESVLNMSVAVHGSRGKDAPTLWVDVTMFGKRAGAVAPLLSKGMRVGAAGELNVREYTARDGTTRQQLELVVGRDFDILESRGERQVLSREEPPSGRDAAQGRAGYSRPPPQVQHRETRMQPPPPDASFADDPDDDIPF